ncbi:hypothetical protein [Saccharomonospora marina]|nr:hypothetical protein [Saccharomonospora marina]
MGQHSERDERGEDVTRAMPPTPATYQPPAADEPGKAEGRSKTDWRAVADRVVATLAGIVRWVGLAFAVVLVLHVVFVIGEANQANSIVSFVADATDTLAMGFRDLFTPEDPKLAVLVNYGIAALFWLVVTAIVARIIRRVGGTD